MAAATSTASLPYSPFKRSWLTLTMASDSWPSSTLVFRAERTSRRVALARSLISCTVREAMVAICSSVNSTGAISVRIFSANSSGAVLDFISIKVLKAFSISSWVFCCASSSVI